MSTEPAVERDDAASLVDILQGAASGNHESHIGDGPDTEGDPDIELALLLIKLSETSGEQELVEALEWLASDAHPHPR